MKLVILILCFIGLSVGMSGQSQPESVPIDEFQNPNCEDLWARLDNFSIQLNSNPTGTGIIAMSGKVNDLRNDLYYEAMILGYFRKRGMSDRTRIVRTSPEAERNIRFWITPEGAKLPAISGAEWSLKYDKNVKPFIFTNGENYSVEITVCLYVNELALLVKILEANPEARINVVLKVRSDKEFARRKRRTITKLTNDYSIPKSRIRIFKQSGFKGDRYGIEPNTEYWLVP